MPNNKKKNKRRGGSKKVKKTPGGKTRRDGATKTYSEMSKSIENMTKVMNQHNLVDRGLFFSDALTLAGNNEGVTDVITELFKKASIGKSGDDKINITDNMRSALHGAAQPLKIMCDHIKDPLSMEDYSAWNKQKILQFLQEHKLRPYPVPSKTILLELANEMKTFVMTCMRNIENLPDDEDAAALGRQTMGTATPQDTAIVNTMNAPVKRRLLTADAQIPSNFHLNNLRKWDDNYQLQYCYDGLAREWCAKQNIRTDDTTNLQLEVAKALMSIACMYDSMIGNPGKDIVCCMDVFKDTPSEMVLHIRPLCAWIMKSIDIGSIPVPIIAVEWHRAKKVEGVSRVQEIMAGMKRGTVFQGIQMGSLEEFELVVEVLKANGSALDVQNLVLDEELKALHKQCTDKAWKFSVICPMDPDRCDIFFKSCPVCRKRATKACTGCDAISYCSKECQVENWPDHKKTCPRNHLKTK